jgi:XTP/dITP diphosphohydrolase
MKHMKIVLATSNLGKLKEMQTIIKQHLPYVDLHPQSDYQIESCEEPYTTFIENALIKARHASQHTHLPALADDSGLCIPCLNNAPGVHSARWADLHNYATHIKDNNQRNNSYLKKYLTEYIQNNNLDAIVGVPAYYYCCMVFVQSLTDATPKIAYGYLHGMITLIEKGHNGFGYDPYFYVPQLNKHLAESTEEEKNLISHRNIALQRIISELKIN